MSESHRDYDEYFSKQMKRNNPVENIHILTCKLILIYLSVRILVRFVFTDDIDAKVYVGNIQTEKPTDG